MFAVQLLRVLEAVPPNMSDITCVKLEPNMKEEQNWATFDDNDKDEFWKRSELEWDKDLHTGRKISDDEFENENDFIASKLKWDKDLHSDRKINNDGFENEHDFVASPVVSSKKYESLEERDFYTDKNVMEFGLPELVACYRENHVKDICVDNGVSSKEKILVDGEICKGLDSEPEVKTELGTCECESTQEVGVEPLPLEQSQPFSKMIMMSNASGEITGYDNEVPSASGEITDEVLIEKLVPSDLNLLGKSNELKSLKALFDSRSSDASDVEHLSDQITHPKTSERPAVGSADDDSNNGHSELSYNSKTESGTITFDFNSVKVEYESLDESLHYKDNNLDQSVKVNSLAIHNSTISSYLIKENKVERGQGDSSFSMAGHVSGLISYSGSIPHSGSISVRSDSSTTSARSFAFPILPNEWNSSPVRMAKADRRRFRRDKGWINGLFCCRF